MSRLKCLLLAAMALSMAGCPGLTDLLKSYGYAEIRPPSDLLAPGSVVWVQTTKPFQAGVVCTQDESLGDDFEVSYSQTATSSLRRKVEGSFQIDAELLEILKAEAGMRSIKNVSVQLTNPTIESIRDTDVQMFAGHRSPHCKAAIAARKAAGFNVTMISSAIRADVVYSVTWEKSAEMDVKARIDAIQGLAARLGIRAVRVDEHTIQGVNLYWGVTDDRYLAQLAEKLCDDACRAAGPGQKLIPLGTVQLHQPRAR